eukprot:5739005-Alexandrium_andersonii.AAC.1
MISRQSLQPPARLAVNSVPNTLLNNAVRGALALCIPLPSGTNRPKRRGPVPIRKRPCREHNNRRLVLLVKLLSRWHRGSAPAPAP